MNRMDDTKMEQELFENHSFEALKYLIECGRELEFEGNGRACFLSKYETSKNFSLWVEQEEQSFSSMEELFENARIGDASLKEIWSKSDIITLF